MRLSNKFEIEARSRRRRRKEEEEKEKLSLNFEIEAEIKDRFSKAGKVLLQFHFIQDVLS